LSTTVADRVGLPAQVAEIRNLKREFERRLATGAATTLPGNTGFLSDGRVLCRARARGDSRYPYGEDGFHLWVSASGYIHANQGRLFLFLPIQDGYEPNIAFFAGTRATGDRYTTFSLLPVPFLAEGESTVQERFTVIGHDATYFITDTAELRTTTRVSLDQASPGGPRLLFSILIDNRSERPVDLCASAYFNPLCRNQFFESSEDRWFKRIAVEPFRAADCASRQETELPPFEVVVHEDINPRESITHRIVAQRGVSLPQTLTGADFQSEVCTSRRVYTGGVRRGMAQAEFLQTGRFAEQIAVTSFNDNAVIADAHRLRLPAGTSARFDYVLTLREDNAAPPGPIDTGYLDASHARVRDHIAAQPHDLSFSIRGCTLDAIADESFNRFFEYLRRQVEVCAQTRGFMQPAPRALIGVRDVCQAIEGQLYDQPAAAKRRLRETLSYILLDGRCPRQYSVPVKGRRSPADLREFVDQGSWVVTAVHTFCATTGDLEFLNERLSYHRIDPKHPDTLERVDESDSVVAHLLRIMDYLERQRDPRTGLLRALYGDWNDALDGLGIAADPTQRFGSGVSVMASLHFYRNCAELIELLEHDPAANHDARIAEVRRIRADLRRGLLDHALAHHHGARRIVHGWGDGMAYYVGSFRDADGMSRDGLTSNAFWILCDMLREDPSLREPILEAFARLDSPYGLKTFEPGFAPDAPGVGRIGHLPIGTAENGAAYIHATAFGIMALFAADEPRRAWSQIHKILPIAAHHRGLSHSPFVMPNSYVDNSQLGLTGQSMNDWQTGSSNALLKTFIRHVVGFRPGFDGLWIEPAAWSPLRGFEFTGRAHGRPVRIAYAKEAVAHRQFFVDDAPAAAITNGDAAHSALRIDYAALDPQRETVIRVADVDDARA
jgi:cellobiose phosphorylase